jgi:hypothetical protein
MLSVSVRPGVTDKHRRLIRQSTSTGLATPRPPRLSTWMEAVYSGEVDEDHASKPGSDVLKDRSIISDKLVSSRRRPMSRRGIEVPAGTGSRRDDRSIVGSWISIGGLGARGGRDRARSCRLGGSRFPGEWGADGSTQARFLIGQGSLASSDPDHRSNGDRPVRRTGLPARGLRTPSWKIAAPPWTGSRRFAGSISRLVPRRFRLRVRL